MSRSESFKRRYRQKLYRKLTLIYNITFVVVILVLIALGSIHMFTNKNAFRQQGIDQFNAGQYSEAIDSFDKALKCNQWFSDNTNVDICLYKAEANILLGDYLKAQETYEYIIKNYKEIFYDKTEIEFMSELSYAMSRYKSEEYDACISTITEAVDKKGYNRVSIFAGIIYREMHRYDEMKKYFDIYTSNYGFNSYMYYQYAVYFIQNNQYNEALDYINKGVEFGDAVYLQELKYLQVLCYAENKDYQKGFELATAYVNSYGIDDKISDLYNFLDTRINPDEEVVHKFFE